MPVSPTVSVVIPFFGDPADTLALIEQLRGQDEADLEIIVSDDVSPTPFPDVEGVQVVRRTQNGGFGAAVNSGVEAATGELLLVLNSDLEISSRFVADLVREAAPFQPCVAGPVLLEGEDRIPAPSARFFPKVRHYAVEWCSPFARFHDTGVWRRCHGHDLAAVPGRVIETEWVVGAVMLIPTASYRAVGGMDENFFMNCEEVDLQYRLRERGVKALFVGTVSCLHEGGGSSADDRRGQWALDARFYLMDKEHGRRGRLQMTAALYAASGVNLLANVARSIYNNDVDVRRITRRELAMIRGHAGPKAPVPARLPR